jgi:type I restriction enzyme S subunit
MELKSGHKLTEVGVIPGDWNCESIRNAASTAPNAIVGGPFGSDLTSSDYVYSGVPVVRGTNMGSKMVVGPFVFVSSSKAHSLSANLARPGDLVFTQRGTLGQVSLVPSGPFDSYLISQSQMKISLNRTKYNPEYVYHFFSSVPGRKQILDSAIQTGVPHTNLGICKRYVFPAPGLSEQSSIAEAINDVDSHLESISLLLFKKKQIKEAAMRELLTGQIRLNGFGPTARFKRTNYGSIPEDWDVKPFKKISSMNGRIGWQGLKQDEFTESPDDPFLITGMNFKDGRIRWEEVYHISTKRYQEAPAIQLQTGDVLVTKDGTIGKLLFVDFIPYPGKASLNSHLLVFRPIEQQYDPKFLFYQLGSPTFAQHIELYKSGTTFFGLTQAATGKFPVVLPSLPEQTAIAAVLSEMDAELAVLEQRQAKTRALKQGMMQELLTGKRRLVKLAAEEAFVC